MRMPLAYVLVACLAYIPSLSGCSGSAGAVTPPAGPRPDDEPPVTGLSAVEIEVEWPEDPYEMGSAALPRATAAIRVTVTAGQDTLLESVIPRPQAPPLRRTQILGAVEPREEAILEVAAYPTPDCTGEALAIARVRIRLPAGELAHMSSSDPGHAIAVELTSLVDRVVVEPDPLELGIDQEVRLAAHAESAEGHLLVVPPDQFQWSVSRGPDIVDVGPDGVVTAKALGHADVIVRETETGASDTAAITVVATYDDLLTVAMHLDFTEVTNNPSPNRWDMSQLSQEIEQMMADSAAAGVDKILFRVDCIGEVMYPSLTHTVYEGAEETEYAVQQDGLGQCVRLAHKYGMQLWAWIEIFETGYSAGGHWDQYFLDRPWLWLLRRGWQDPLSWREREFWFGMPCYACPEARERRVSEFEELASMYDIDGFYVCTRKHGDPEPETSGNLDYGYNPIIVEEYEKCWGVDPSEVVHANDPTSIAAERFSQLKAKYITQLIAEAKAVIRGLPLVVQVGYKTCSIDTDWTYMDYKSIFGQGLSDRAWCWRVSRADALQYCDRIVPTSGFYRIYDWGDVFDDAGQPYYGDDGTDDEMRERHANNIRNAVRDCVSEGHDELTLHEQYWFEVEDLYPALRAALDERVE